MSKGSATEVGIGPDGTKAVRRFDKKWADRKTNPKDRLEQSASTSSGNPPFFNGRAQGARRRKSRPNM